MPDVDAISLSMSVYALVVKLLLRSGVSIVSSEVVPKLFFQLMSMAPPSVPQRTDFISILVGRK